MTNSGAVEIVADALAERFKRTVSESAGKPFEETKVALPHRSIWLDYARAAIEGLREPGSAVISAIEAKAHERYMAAPAMERWYGEDVWAAGIDAALNQPEPPNDS